MRAARGNCCRLLCVQSIARDFSVMTTHTSQLVSQNGYSLIELVVVVGLMVLLMGGGIAAFSSFNDRQKAVEGARTLQSWLRTAQSRARALEKPPGCDQLHSYRVSTITNSDTVETVAVCNAANDELGATFLTLPEGLTLQTTATLDFLVLHGGIEINQSAASAVDLVVSGGGGFSNSRYGFTVTKGGEIREGDYVE